MLTLWAAALVCLTDPVAAVPGIATTAATRPTPATEPPETERIVVAQAATADTTPKKKSKRAAKAASKPDDPASTARRLLDSGIKSVKAGKDSGGIEALSGAMQTGKLSTSELARALYYRGVAFRRSGKPAQAIADLTSATWLQGGLAAADRADALAQRSAAYREAGLAEPAGGRATGGKIAAVAPAAPATGEVGGTWSADTRLGAPSAPARRIKGAAQAESGAVVAPAAGVQASASAGTTSSDDSVGSIGSFFGNLFGGAPAANPQAVEAATPKRRARVPSVPSATASTTSWSSATEIRTRDATSGAPGPTTGQRVAAAPAPPAGWSTSAAPRGGAARPAKAARAASAAPASAKGRFRVRVGAVRSATEAEAIGQRLRREHAAVVGDRTATVRPTVLGNMGTFYQVEVGPFADLRASRSACDRIRSSGLDCVAEQR